MALPQRYPVVTFTATADPYDARVGSGGGTVAALTDHITIHLNDEEEDGTTTTGTRKCLPATVLILHAGGAASRCPTQMCLGKAWTSLPSLGSGSLLYTPLQVWLDQCQRIFGSDGTKGKSTLPRGSVVVVATDTLLQLMDPDDNGTDFASLDWSTELRDRDVVLGLAVPAPLSTAKNHGVFVPDNHTDTVSSRTGSIRIESCRAVLQKPSIEDMTSTAGCCFMADPATSTGPNDDIDHSSRDELSLFAWIDTGVTIFSPSAAYRLLYDFTRQNLPRCTAKGLQQLYHLEHDNNSPTTDHHDMATFASQTALSVDLYTHFLQALALSNESKDTNTERRQRYKQAYSKELPTEIVDAIWNTFSSCPLHILAVPRARFWHLGTTVELKDFLMMACGGNHTNTISTTTTATRSQECQAFGAQLGLMRRLRSYTQLGGNRFGESCIHPSAVIYDSILSMHCSDSCDERCRIDCYVGSNTVIEHCNIQTTDGYVHIGANCLVSGLRTLPLPPPITRPSTSFHIPDSFIIQIVQLSTKVVAKYASPVVIMALHMNDDIKKCSTVYGRTVESFLRRSQLTESDIWDVSNSSPRSIWTAKIHPIVYLSNNESFESVFTWLRYLDCDDLEVLSSDTTFLCWKNCQRLSLSEIRDVTDATKEFVFRNELVSIAFPRFMSEYIHSLERMLCERQQSVPIDFQFLVDNYSCVDASKQSSNHCSIRDVVDTMHAMDQVLRENVNQAGSRDISARAAMLLSGLLDDIAKAVPRLDMGEDPGDNADRLSLLSLSLRASFDRDEMKDIIDDLNRLALIRDEFIVSKQLPALAKSAVVFEELASILTGLHIRAATGSGTQKSLHCHSPIYDKWVVATAPARIDLSGGWSDTPPICYEFGSSVTGMAVRIDHKKPLLSRCRIVLGGTGMLLRTEHRDLKNGNLLSELQIEIASFNSFLNYRDPTSDCALLKCVLVHLGFIPTLDGSSDFQATLNHFCGNETSSVRLEVVATSVLPHGSGLGTSSILAGCILASVGQCIGAGYASSSLPHDEYLNDMIDSVLNVEQYLTTGGGYQDQVNGLFGGVKISSSVKNEYPMKVKVETLTMSDEFQNDLNNHVYLVYTGTTRLAKNLLKQVLYRWSKHTPEITETIKGLVNGAVQCRDAIQASDLDKIGQCLSEYWSYKKVMAGPNSGVEPSIVTKVIQRLNDNRLIRGASLCGAGGGGFMVLMTASGRTLSDIQSSIKNDRDNIDAESVDSFSWHTCQVCMEGLSTKVMDGDIPSKADDFSIDWLSSTT